MNPVIKKLLLINPLILFSISAEATVFEPLLNDIKEPVGIYYPSPPDVLRVDAQTIIGSGPCVSDDYSGCTLEDVHNDINTDDDFKPEVNIHFTADDFLNGEKIPNATLRLRGQTSRLKDLKSYRIKLDSKEDLWRGERRLQLNKHISDLTRVKNKLSFDLMATIPHLPSLRTQFVNLLIDGTDFGIYTHVEYAGKEYLQRRNWDKDSGLYKAEKFDFTMNDKLLLDDQGKPQNVDAFENVLEIKRGDDHRVLLEMIEAVNDETNDFKTDVLDKYFNLNNLLTWEAMIILMGNTDVTTYNYYLYNPKGTHSFYFLPWDFDATWGYDWHPTIVEGNWVPGRRYQGPHNLWATTFGKRFLSMPGALDLLNQAVLEIKNKYLTPQKINAYTNDYYDLVFPFIIRQPDIENLDTNQPTATKMFAEYNAIYDELANTVQRNYKRYLKSQNSPMPFHINTPYLEGSNIVFDWEEAVDLQGDVVTYDLEIADKPEFTPGDIKFSIKNLTNPTYTAPWMLPRGDYFYRIIARDSSNPVENWQLGFEEFYVRETAFTGYGVESFSVDFDGVEVVPNPTPTIIIDGKQSDWVNTPHWTDPDDIQITKVVDWRRAWFTEDNHNVYLAYQNDDKINTNNLWAWHAYMDTDNNQNTGYRVSDTVAAEYLLEGNKLWKYTGDGESWSWQSVTEVHHAVKNTFAEFSIPKVRLNNPTGYGILLYGVNGFLKPNTQVDIMSMHPENH